MKQKRMIVIMRILGWLGIILLFFTLAFEALPLMSNTTLGTFRLMTRQRVLQQRIVKNVLILAYQTSSDEHVEAINELQTTLPVWEQVQKGLRLGDASLGISANLPGDIELLLTQAQPDFAYMDAAARQILARPSPVDPVQLAIIQQHDQPYYLTMAQVSDLFQERIQGAAKIYFGIELGMGIALMSIWIAFLLFIRSFNKRSKT
jgi:hypothetical protein